MNEDGSVVIGVNMNVSDAEKQLARLDKRILSLEKERDKANVKESRARQQAEQTYAEYEKQKAALNKINDENSELFESHQAQLEILREYRQELDDINAQIKALPAGASADSLYQQKENIKARIKASEALNNSDLQAQVNAANEKIDHQNQLLNESIEKYNQARQAWLNEKNIVDSITSEIEEQKRDYNEIENHIRNIKNNTGETENNTENIRRNTENTKKNLDDTARSTNRVATATSRADSFLGRFSKRVVGLAKRVFVFSLITSALRNVRSYFADLIRQNSSLSESLGRVKGNLLTAFQAIWTTVLPALEKMAVALAKATAWIAAFINALMGKNLKQTQQAAKDLYEESKAIDAVGGAAADASKQLASFDEINKLEGSGGGGGGGASAGTGIEPIFDAEDIQLSDNVLKAIDKIRDFVKFVKEHMDIIWPIVKDIGVAFATWKLTTSFLNGLGVASGNVGLIGLAVAGIVTNIEEIIENWNQVKGFIGGAAEAMQSLQKGDPEGFWSGVDKAWLNWLESDTLYTALQKGILGEDTWNAALEFFRGGGSWQDLIDTSAIDWLIEKIGIAHQALVDVQEWLAGAWQWLNTNVFNPIGDGAEFTWKRIKDVYKGVSTWWQINVTGPINTSVEKAFNSVKEIAKDAWDKIKKTFQNVSSWWQTHVSNPLNTVIKNQVNSGLALIEKGINWMIGQLNNVLTAMNSAFQKLPGIDYDLIPLVPSVSIPRLAQGAVIPPNREFMAVLGDQKSGTNIEAPLSTIEQAVENVLNRRGLNGGGDTTIILELDRQQFGKLVFDANNRESRRIGVRLAEV